MRISDLTRVPRAPRPLIGVDEVRGAIIAAADIGPLLGGTERRRYSAPGAPRRLRCARMRPTQAADREAAHRGLRSRARAHRGQWSEKADVPPAVERDVAARDAPRSARLRNRQATSGARVADLCEPGI